MNVMAPAEVLARQRLRRSRRLAVGLLLAAAVLFVVTSVYVGRYPALAYVKAFAEAAMIGALADWFAVVALFRHPLGLPIPHTAILPRNQNRIADELGRFIEHNFLHGRSIALRVYQARPTEQLLQWLRLPENQASLLPLLTRQIPPLLRAVKPEQMALFLSQLLQKQYSGKSLGQTLSQLLALVHAQGHHQVLLVTVFKQIRHWLRQEHTRTLLEQNINAWAAKIEKEHPSTWDKIIAALKGSAVDMVDGWVARKALAWADHYVEEVLNTPEHVMRRNLDAKVAQMVKLLAHSRVWHRRLDGVKQQLTESAAVQDAIAQAWLSLQRWSEQDIRLPESLWQQQVHKLLQQMVWQGAQQPEVLRRFDVRLSLWVRDGVNQYKHKVGQFVAEKVKSWDSAELVRKLELSVGKDLQYIRINGTLVGGLVGLLIYWLSQWLANWH